MISKLMSTIILLVSIFNGAMASIKSDRIADLFPSILNINYTPIDSNSKCEGLFTDAGSWIGFTPPASCDFVNGFCGPFSINDHLWLSRSIAEVGVERDGRKYEANSFKPDSTSYYPGVLHMSSKSNKIRMEQQLNYVDKNHTVLKLNCDNVIWDISSTIWLSNTTLILEKNTLIIRLQSGEVLTVSFPDEFKLSIKEKSYNAKSLIPTNCVYVLISFYNNDKQRIDAATTSESILRNPAESIMQSEDRWNNYLSKALRNDLPIEFNRIAAKSIVTLLSDWRGPKGDLLHEGIMPSYTYFLGFWAWDSWKHAVAIAHFAPELAKNQVRAMFDYQTDEGMIPDVIYTDRTKNNLLNSKPPLAAWAVMEIYKQTNDLDFVKEMFSKLRKYNEWWYQNRDHDQNGICEFGATIGDSLAAKWESGMDNAVRFDDSKMLKNSETAWSLNQESVDLNAFLFLEKKTLADMASLMNSSSSDTVERNSIDNYFFDTSKGYYYDRKLAGGFVGVEGCEGFIPMWTKLSSARNADVTLLMYKKQNKFSSFIPFPSLSTDNPEFTYNGYWRGPIWLDQVYFGISGIRNYGHSQDADELTEKVFNRLQGLKGIAPIYENYDPYTGNQLRAPHFGWSAAHLLMLYWEYGK
jgi:putative isomerase